MELFAYVRALVRWLWLIVLVAIIAGVVGFLFTKIQHPQYAATATIQIGAAKFSPNPGTDELLAEQNLADDYAVLAKTDPILNAAAANKSLGMSASDINLAFQVNILPNTTLIQIAATSSDAQKAADIANAVANALVASNSNAGVKEQQDLEALLNVQITSTQAQLDALQQTLKDTDAQLTPVAAGTAAADLSAQHTSLTDQIRQYQSNLALFISTLLEVQKQSNTNTLLVVQPANLPTKPNGPPVLGIIILAAVLGGVVAAGGVVTREFLRDAIHNPSELSARFGLDIIGVIAPFGRTKNAANRLVMWRNPQSPVAESYRALRVNLTYSDKDIIRHPQVYVVSSPNPGEGKSVTAANLAVAFAITGAQVLLVDADVRRPTQHTIFNVSNLKGLLDIAGKNTLPERTSDQKPADTLSGLVMKTEVPGLSLLTAGTPPSTPTELLGTIRMQEILHGLATNNAYDVVIFDTPPLLSVSDSTLVASVTHGSVVLIIDPNRTQRGSVIRVVQQLSTLGIPLVGIVLNRFHGRQLDSNFGAYVTGRYEPVLSNTGRLDPSDLPANTMLNPGSGH